MKLTNFQKQVYKAILEIPIGQVRSYSWVAKKIGKPKAVRAVGIALKKNPFAPIVPCHRVINSNGKLGGYSAAGGLKKKKELIMLEREIRRCIFNINSM